MTRDPFERHAVERKHVNMQLSALKPRKPRRINRSVSVNDLTDISENMTYKS